MFLTTTATPGSTPPLASVTTPSTLPLADCANMRRGTSSARMASMRKRNGLNRCMGLVYGGDVAFVSPIACTPLRVFCRAVTRVLLYFAPHLSSNFRLSKSTSTWRNCDETRNKGRLEPGGRIVSAGVRRGPRRRAERDDRKHRRHRHRRNETCRGRERHRDPRAVGHGLGSHHPQGRALLDPEHARRRAVHGDGHL